MIYHSKNSEITRFVMRYEHVENDKNYQTWRFTDLDIDILKTLLINSEAARAFHINQPKRQDLPFHIEFAKVFNVNTVLKFGTNKNFRPPWYERIAHFLFDETDSNEMYAGKLDEKSLGNLTKLHDVGCFWNFVFYLNQPKKYYTKLDREFFEVDKYFFDLEQVHAVVFRDFVSNKLAIAVKSNLDMTISDLFWRRKEFIVEGKIDNVFASEDLTNLAKNKVVQGEL